MTTATLPAKTKTNEALILLVSAIAIAFALFFIDEGYYDFRWMKNPGNWIAFTAYVLMLFVGQLVVLKLFLRAYKGFGRLPISIVGGTVLVLTIVFTAFNFIG
jgi:hypothetical protein